MVYDRRNEISVITKQNNSATIWAMALEKIREKYERYERHIGSAALLVGFIFDNITFPNINLGTAYLILFIYFVIAALGIVIVNVYEEWQVTHGFLVRSRTWLLFLVQFSFGALFSSFVVFYSRSASIIASWPFILVLVLLLIGNELLRKHYARLSLHMSVLFMALFSFMIFYTPVIVGKMGDEVFLVSGILSLLIMFLFVYGLSYLTPRRVEAGRRMLLFCIAIVFVLVNVMYFLNIIPPIPLSLKDVDVYHAVVKDGEGNYVVQAEIPPSWLESIVSRETVHVAPGETVYVFSAVFAPLYLTTDVTHRWYFYEPETGEWVFMSEATFPITG